MLQRWKGRELDIRPLILEIGMDGDEVRLLLKKCERRRAQPVGEAANALLFGSGRTRNTAFAGQNVMVEKREKNPFQEYSF